MFFINLNFKVMIIYLSKSNRCNPNHVMAVREFLHDSFPNDEIREFTGGSYNRNFLLESDCSFTVTEGQAIKDDENERFISDIGRGIYTEVKEMLDKSMESEKHSVFYCHFPSLDETEFTIHPVIGARITNLDNWTKYGKLSAVSNSVSIAYIKNQFE